MFYSNYSPNIGHLISSPAGNLGGVPYGRVLYMYFRYIAQLPYNVKNYFLTVVNNVMLYGLASGFPGLA